MGFFKQQVIADQDREFEEIANWRAARVSAGGGDRMSSSFLAQLDALIANGAAQDPCGPIPAPHDGSEEAIAADAAADQAAAAQDGLADQLQTLERQGDLPAAGSAPVSEPPPAIDAAIVAAGPAETPEQKLRRLELNKPILGSISTEKMVHGSMILNGICSQCVRCCFKLTDAVSIERGMGPECSSKGYAEDPTDPDELGAMIELAEYPALVDFLTQHYKPLGVRGLMNGLVRIAALNRKSPVHGACANAIEMLGYKKLAATLRDALIMMKIKKSELHPGHLHVRVRGREWTREWSSDCYKSIPHCFYDKQEKGLIVADRKETKAALWTCMMRHYSGECASTPNGTVKIPSLDEWEAKRQAKRAASR